MPRTPRRSTTFAFAGVDFVVDAGVFDPVRHLSGIALAKHLAERELADRCVLDLGTGCGILAYACWMAGASVVATDVSRAAVACATRNLSATEVDIRHGAGFIPVVGNRFDTLVTNPPYEIGGRRHGQLRSPDLLFEIADRWTDHADHLILGFPTDSIDILEAAGLEVTCTHRLTTDGRELGVFEAVRSSRPDPARV